MTVTRRSGHHAGVAGSPAGGAAVPAAAASFAAAAAPSSSASQPPPQQQEATAVLPTPPAVVMTAPKKGTSSSNSKQASSARRQSAAPSSLALDGPATLAHPLAPNSQRGAAAGASAAATAASQSTSSSGAVTIEDAAVDALIEQPFPRKSHAKALQPKDQQDELLMFCARAVACCGNRALTPKEIAAIASRKWNWACSGTQPFAVISSCIRAHLRRAEKAKPPYPAMFRSYELTSVPPPEDIPCLGIEPEARPVVKRGTFWFLTEAMGFQSPFQHRLGEEILGSNVGGKDGSDGKGQATLSATSSGASLGNDNSVTEGTAPSALTASLLAQGQTPTTKTAKEEKPLTRAQKAQLGTGISAPPVVFQHQLIAPAPAPGTIPLATTAPAAGPTARKEGSAVDTLGRGKRKRTASQAVNKLSTAGATQNHLPPVAGGPVVGGARPPQAGSSTPTSAVVSATASTAPQAKDTGVHRRALSSSASDTSKPSFSGFRKLKFRLSALSELPSPNASPFVKKTASAPRVTGPCPPAASAQPLSKRQRTQSMSQLSSSTSFPFDNLLHGLSSSLHSRPEAGHRANTHVVPTPHGTIHPLDIHNLHISPAPSSLYPSASPHHFDSLASRSAPDNNIFSPPLQTTSHVSGPFSRSHSPSSYFNKIRSAHTAESDAPSPASYAGEAESVTPYGGVDMMDLSREYDGWSAGHRSLTDSAILAAQRELTGAASSSAAEAQHLSDYHEAMLKSDLDLDFDFSLNSLRESSVIKEDLAASAQDALSIAVDVTSATPDEEEEESFQMDLGESGHLDSELDGVFDGLSPGGAEGVEDSAMAEVSAAHTQMTEEEFEDDGEEDIEGLDSAVLPGLGARRSKSLAESIARHRALSTTLCPAAGKTRADSSKSVRPIARRINSKSNLAFPKLSVSGDGLSTPRLRPSTISRTNSRHVLTTPVPLVELPSIPLLSSSDLVYKLHSDADSHDKDRARFSEDGDSRVAFTPNIKAEEEDAENAFNVDVDGDEASSLLPPAARSASTSRSSSVESATDPFRPEAYVRAASMASSSATAVNEGTLEAVAARSIPRSRSQSSSRRTSLSPRDSFSPQASGPHADWALTPPSEEEAMMEDEEKNLDRATLLGPESVDVEEFDDVWPYSFGEFRQRLDERVSDTDVAESAQQVESIPTATAADQQLSCSTSGAGIFEPILAAAPLPPQAEAAPVFSQHITASLTESSVTGDAMAVDQQPARPRSRTVTANLPPVFMRSNGKTRNTGDGRASNTPSPITAALPSHRPIWPAPANSTSLPQQKGMSARLSAADSGSAAAPAATQSFLFQPETPFDPPINILLTEKKVLFYQTCVAGSSSSLATFPMPLLPRGLLRRVDNDAVEVDALVAICAAADPEMKDTCMEKLQQVKADGNTWVDIVAARAIVAACGRGSQLDDFLADDILLAWNDKLQKLGVWLRSKNGLKFPVGAAHSATAFTRSSSSVCPSPPTPTAASAMLPTDKLPASASRPRSVQPSLSPRVRSRKVSSSLAAAPTVAVDAVVIPAETAEDSKLDAARPSHPSLPEAPLKVDTRSAVQPVKAAPKTPRAGTGKAPSPVSTNTPGPTSASTRRSARNKNAA